MASSLRRRSIFHPQTVSSWGHQATLEHTLAGGADSIRDMDYKVKKLEADKKQVRAYYQHTIINQTLNCNDFTPSS